MVRIRYKVAQVEGKNVLVSARPILAGDKVYKVVLDGQLGKLLNNSTEEVELTVTANNANKLKLLVKSTLSSLGATFTEEVRTRNVATQLNTSNDAPAIATV